MFIHVAQPFVHNLVYIPMANMSMCNFNIFLCLFLVLFTIFAQIQFFRLRNRLSHCSFVPFFEPACIAYSLNNKKSRIFSIKTRDFFLKSPIISVLFTLTLRLYKHYIFTSIMPSQPISSLSISLFHSAHIPLHLV